VGAKRWRVGPDGGRDPLGTATVEVEVMARSLSGVKGVGARTGIGRRNRSEGVQSA
jgi:hypothetical protein